MPKPEKCAICRTKDARHIFEYEKATILWTFSYENPEFERRDRYRPVVLLCDGCKKTVVKTKIKVNGAWKGLGSVLGPFKD